MLELRDLNVSYGQIPVIHGVNVKVSPGEIVALIGCNGAGKTTILRTISGLMRPQSGSVSFDGVDITKMAPHEIVRLGLSQVPERRGIFANLSVAENLKMGGYVRKITSSEYDEVFAIFPRLKERVKQVAGTLSGGEQQMLAIGRALLARPKLILLDEPSLGLAPQITQIIFQTIQKINAAGATVLLVEQNAFGALKISHRGYVLEVGKVVLVDQAQALLTNPSVKKAYLGEL